MFISKLSSSPYILSGLAIHDIANDVPIASLLIDSKGHGFINRENRTELLDGKFKRNDEY